MPENSLQKISRIILSSKEIRQSPKKALVQFQNSSQDLNDDTVKTKLEACLFGLKNVNQMFKKDMSQKKTLSSRFDVSSSTRSSHKNLQSILLPKIPYEEEKRKLLIEKKISNQKLLSQDSYLLCSSEIVNSSVLKQRLNHSSLPPKQNKAIDLSKTAFPKMLNSKLIENIALNKTSSFNISFKKKDEKSKIGIKQVEQPKKLQFPPKIKKHLYETAQGKTLSKQNRYFLNQPPVIDQKEIQKIGLYESSNRYRKEFLCKEMNNLSPKIEKKELQMVKVCKQNELFLTRPKELQPTDLDQFLKGQFIINESKPKRYFQTIKTEEIEQRERQAKLDMSSIKQQVSVFEEVSQKQNTEDHIAEDVEQNQKQELKHKSLTFFQIKNYQIVKNESYIKFRVLHIQIWEDIQSLLGQLIVFVKELKISTCKFKANHLLDYWSGRRLTVKDMETILKMSRKQIISREKSAIQNVLGMLHAKRKMKSIIEAKAKRLSYMKWVCDRMIGIRSIKKETQYKIKKAYEIHEKLLEGDYTWDTEIYISSFSENSFVRNTTQYMESFENMFSHMWKESSKHMILVIPTINSEILQIYQEKLKIKRSITLICPQVHELFPVNMSLAGCLLFSYDALNKIRQLIEGKNAIIIPGKFSSPQYELLISQFLRTPLMTSLKPRRDLEFQKQLFSSANLSVLPYICIRPQTTIDQIISQFAKLLISHRQINKWVFKINGEFSGRGLATFCIKSSKVLKSILSSCKDTIKPLQEYLKQNLKLKLKINFQNSLFMFGDYLQRLAEKGGIIEEQKDQIESYQVSFFIENKITCSLVSCFKCFSVNHSNKAYIYETYPNPKISSILPKLKSNLQANEYLGYVSVNLVISGDKVYGIEIKPYLTHLTSVEPFIKSIESKRQLKLNLSGQGHQKMQNELISSTLRNDFISKRKQPNFENGTSLNVKEKQNRAITDQSHLFSNINLSVTELQTIRPNLNEFTHLFIPNIILTDVPIPQKAEFIESLIMESFTRPKFDILDNNLVLYLSNGLSLSLLIVGREMKKIKKTAIEVVRFLSERSGALKIYCGKNEARDVFQFGDIIKAVTQIKS